MHVLSYMRTVSSAVNSCSDIYRTAEYIADLLIQIPGIAGVQFAGLGVIAGSTKESNLGVAASAIRFQDDEWGQVRIAYERHINVAGSLDALAEFVGQQLGMLLSMEYSVRQNETLRRAVLELRADLERANRAERLADARTLTTAVA